MLGVPYKTGTKLHNGLKINIPKRIFVNSKLIFTKSNFCYTDAKLLNLNAQKRICLIIVRLNISLPDAFALV
jgi:hypothetical protein